MNATATQRQTADERRDAIVVAALREFAARGYSGTSTESIARAVGVSQPYLFQLFGTKRELFLAVVRHGFERTRLVFHEAAKRGPQDDPACSILDLMGQAYMRLLSDRDLLRVQLQAYAASVVDEDVRESTARGYGRLVDYVETVSGADRRTISGFFAKGMLMNVLAAMDYSLAEEPKGSWASRLAEGCAEDKP